MRRNKIGQTLLICTLVMIGVGLLSCALTASVIGKGAFTETAGITICWSLTVIGGCVISWYTAKHAEKNKMQMAVAVIGVYVCISMLMGRIIFSDRELKMSVWIAVLMGASVLGSVMACMKKERKR